MLSDHSQATKGVSATQSGISILPFMISTTVAAGVSGAAVSVIVSYLLSIESFQAQIESCHAGLLLALVHRRSDTYLYCRRIAIHYQREQLVSSVNRISDCKSLIPQICNFVRISSFEPFFHL